MSTSAVTLALIFALAARADEGPLPVDEGAVERLAPSAIVFATKAPGDDRVVWRHEVIREGRQFLRLLFAEVNDSGLEDYDVVLRNAGFEVVKRYDRETFKARPEFWTDVVKGDTIVVEVIADAAVPDLTFRIAEVAIQEDAVAPLSQVGDDNMVEIHQVADPRLVSTATGVAKLTFVKNGRVKACTAWLVADDTVLTNEHCISTQETCETAVAIFGFQNRSDGTPELGEQFSCKELKSFGFERDFSLLRLAGNPGASGRWQVMRLCDRPVLAGERLAIVQHPGGRPKMAVLEDCRVQVASVAGRDGVVAETDFAHICDTQRGSSGSPVLDKDGIVVGLHHLGFTVAPFADVNRAVKMSELLPLIGIPTSCATEE